ncbi:MAG: hypothetical protein HZC42_13075 [Candidatus Eisenbacteria bacterium]|nr:hypothetical protein [Candidatus Eisenbacteria bacterium]
MPGGRARFACVPLPRVEVPPGKFYLTTRRGRQFNSMSHGGRDHLMGGATRRDVLISPADAARVGARAGAELLLTSEVGTWVGVARLAPMKERCLQAYWPEVNVLIPRAFDPVSGEPDYNTFVTAEPVLPVAGMTPARVEEPAQAVAQPAMAHAMERALKPQPEGR